MNPVRAGAVLVGGAGASPVRLLWYGGEGDAGFADACEPGRALGCEHTGLVDFSRSNGRGLCLFTADGESDAENQYHDG